jgi:transposase InsO family protein
MRVNPREIILSLKQNSFDISKTSSQLGIHKTTIYRWIKRARSISGNISSANLKRFSTKPKKTFKLILSSKQTADIVKLRKETGWTAEKITYYLKLNCCSRTTHRVLQKHCLIKPYSYYRRPRFQDTVHMHAKNTKTIGYLQMDVKYITPELSGLEWTCFEYGVIDIYSRYKEAVILNQLDSDGAILALFTIIPRLPFKPIFIQTDNGLEFQGKFRETLKSLKLKHHFVHKRTPNENAIIERSFRTDEEEFFFRLNKQPNDYDDLRQLFAKYLKYYNQVRPHFGINLKTPYQVIQTVA